VDDETLLEVCQAVVEAVTESLEALDDRSGAGRRPGQYALDLVADEAALPVFEEAGLGVLSEESGLHRPNSPLIAVVDPVDGSTNASRGIPWYATSICILDEAGARVATVANLATGERYQAIRGKGASKDGTSLQPSGCTELGRAIVALSGFPGRHLGWAQFRALGSAALELCAVAEGTVDAFMVAGGPHSAPWDYLGGVLVCCEAGAEVCDLDDRELAVADPAARRSVAGAATTELLEALRSASPGPPGAVRGSNVDERSNAEGRSSSYGRSSTVQG
jgi:myo-inositol-1(or 4)-monophosphatase